MQVSPFKDLKSAELTAAALHHILVALLQEKTSRKKQQGRAEWMKPEKQPININTNICIHA